MKKQIFFAAGLIFTPYLAIAATEGAATTSWATEKSMVHVADASYNRSDNRDRNVKVRDTDASNNGINSRDRNTKTMSSTEKSRVRDGDASNTGINKRDRDDQTLTQRDADNTGINKRDRDDRTLTPMDQMNNQSDLDITQEIRQSLMKDEFSMDAKNIKVITRNGAVTLRGPVKSAAELERISVQVKAMPGIKSIDNQLQVK